MLGVKRQWVTSKKPSPLATAIVLAKGLEGTPWTEAQAPLTHPG